MQRNIVLIISIIVVCTGLTAACGRRVPRVDPRPTLIEFDQPAHGYTKKVAVYPIERGEMANRAALQAYFYRTFVEILRARSAHVDWVIPGDDGFPEYALQGDADASLPAVAETARRLQGEGFAALLGAALVDIQPHEQETGFWFFRKTRYSVTIAASMDILDPFTTAKFASIDKEEHRKVTAADYNLLKAGRWEEALFLRDMLKDSTVALAQNATDELQRLPWQAVVTLVQGDRVGLAVGRRQGLSIGDRLAVFEGRRTVKGYQDRKYIAPGFKVGDITIVELEEDSATALVQDAAEIRAGDIAVAGS